MAGHKSGALMLPASSNLYAVDLGADCPPKLPPGCRFIGSLHSDSLGTGALTQVINSGIYALVVEGSIHHFNQFEIERTLRKLQPSEGLPEMETTLGFAKLESLFGDIGLD